MKTVWIKGLSAIALVALIAWVLTDQRGRTPKLQAPTASWLDRAPSPPGLRAAGFTKEQREDLARIFRERFKPALERWCNAYEGRIPFRPEDVTLDQFHSRLGRQMYTF